MSGSRIADHVCGRMPGNRRGETFLAEAISATRTTMSAPRREGQAAPGEGLTFDVSLQTAVRQNTPVPPEPSPAVRPPVEPQDGGKDPPSESSATDTDIEQSEAIAPDSLEVPASNADPAEDPGLSPIKDVSADVVLPKELPPQMGGVPDQVEYPEVAQGIAMVAGAMRTDAAADRETFAGNETMPQTYPAPRGRAGMDPGAAQPQGAAAKTEDAAGVSETDPDTLENADAVPSPPARDGAPRQTPAAQGWGRPPAAPPAQRQTGDVPAEYQPASPDTGAVARDRVATVQEAGDIGGRGMPAPLARATEAPVPESNGQTSLVRPAQISGGGGPSPQGAVPAPAAQEPPGSPEPAAFEQIVLGLRSRFDARNGKAEIRLEPPNLGTVKVTVTLDKGNLTAAFESSSQVVRDLLKSRFGELRTVLQSQGVTVDRLAVESPPPTRTDIPPERGQSSSGSAAHDGRSAGEYQQDPHSGRRTPEGEAFAKLVHEVREAPLDLVA